MSIEKTNKEIKGENWKALPFADHIEISDLGRIKTKRGISRGAENSKGYLNKTIAVNGERMSFKVHRLVMLCFVGPSNLDVNHKNGIKSDNRLVNLEYCTKQQNNLHACRTGLNPPVTGERVGNSKLKEHQVFEVYESKESDSALGRKFGVSSNAIRYVRIGKLWKKHKAQFEALVKERK